MSESARSAVVFGMMFVIWGTIAGSAGFYFGYREGVYQMMVIRK